MESLLKCAVCSGEGPDFSTTLGIPLCPKCWKVPVKKDKPFGFQAEIDQITPKIYLGNEEAQKKKAVLKALGVTHILVIGRGLYQLHKNDFTYENFEIDDCIEENIGQFFDQAFDFIEAADGRVFVHCGAGISRSGSIVIAYIMRKEGKSYEEAVSFVRERRSSVKPNDGFVKQLIDYGEKFKNK